MNVSRILALGGSICRVLQRSEGLGSSICPVLRGYFVLPPKANPITPPVFADITFSDISSVTSYPAIPALFKAEATAFATAKRNKGKLPVHPSTLLNEIVFPAAILQPPFFNMDADDAVILADELPAKEAMVKLNMSNNRIEGAEAGKALGDALAADTVLEELDLSENYSGPEFAKEFAVGLGANGALATITFGDRQTVTMATTMTEADFSDKLYSHEAHIVAAFLPKCQ